ncbi:alpha-glucosidase [Natronincola peptidivorans]|uniref:Alpha-glucosidase n=2 Tax=Natronincola peptidivorans TaxID=426128 RepID=A0A1I0BTI1_9FIRM|nr:alpha-glucosidase [Natronincola peptidivorans]
MKYRIGNPFETDAVLQKGRECDKENIEYFQIEETEGFRLSYRMTPQDIIWGLGENQKGMNKRGGVYVSYCTDDPNHTPDKKSLYGAHNFFVVDGEEKFGVFIDYPSKVTFDIGFTHSEFLDITVEGKDFDLYILKGTSLREIVQQFLSLIGESYCPPKWAFGYQQSRWSYMNAEEVEKIVDSFLYYDIPCDAVYLDIDYMEKFKDFTVDDASFPNFEGFVKKIKDKGFRLVPIIDAGVKIEKGYDVYEEGIEKNYFCVDEKGEAFVAAVWPGRVHFPDFLNPEARRWFGLKYKGLIDWGIEGFWNDMNEPAIFYTNKELHKAVEKAKEAQNQNLDIYSYFELRDAFVGLLNNLKDYQDFYHKSEGKLVNHDKLHNLYGYNMTRAAAEAFEEIQPDKRFLMFSRASYIGAHRYGGIWTGDNHSWWEHLLLNVKMMSSLNMCGFLYSGADTGGFGGDVNPQLMIRWMQFSLFTPLFRNHSAMGTRRQEPFAFDEGTLHILRNIIRLRYALIPYIYSEFMRALLNRDVYMAPLAFHYDDERSRRVEDQLLVGDALMITPIYEENAGGRYVWIPEEMLLWKAVDYKNRSYQIYKKGNAYLEADMQETPIFIRKNHIVLLGKHGSSVEELCHDELEAIAFVDSKATYVYYDDDGTTKEYKNRQYKEVLIEIEKIKNDFQITIINKGNDKLKKISFEILDIQGNMTKKIVEVS